MSVLTLDQIRDLMECLGFLESNYEIQLKEEKLFRFSGFRVCQIPASADLLSRIEELPEQDRRYIIIEGQNQINIRAWSHR